MDILNGTATWEIDAKGNTIIKMKENNLSPRLMQVRPSKRDRSVDLSAGQPKRDSYGQAIQ